MGNSATETLSNGDTLILDVGGNPSNSVGFNDRFIDLNLFTVSGDAVEFDSLRFDSSSFVGARSMADAVYNVSNTYGLAKLAGTTD